MQVETRLALAYKSKILEQGTVKEAGQYLQGLRCPACGHPDAYTYTETPYKIYCNRKNKCGVISNCKDVFPEISTLPFTSKALKDRWYEARQ